MMFGLVVFVVPTFAAEPPTSVILDAQRTINTGSIPGEGVVAGGQFYFVARTSKDPDFSFGTWSLFRTDGTAAGTRLIQTTNGTAPSLRPVQDPSLLPADQNPSTLATLNNTVLFRGEGELWRTDGTLAGTFQVRDINPGIDFSAPDELVAVGTQVFFSAHNGTHGRELWKTDGTSNGTVMVRDIRPGANGSAPQGLTACGNLLYFVAFDGSVTRLWVSDGTSNGTVMVGNFTPGVVTRLRPRDYLFPESRYQIRADGNRVMFYSPNITTSFPMTIISGSTPSSLVVTQLMPIGFGSFGSSVRIVTGGGRFYFRQHPNLWSTDGTSENTALFDTTLDTLVEEFYWHSNAVNGTRLVGVTNVYFYMGPGRADGSPTGSVRVADFYTDEVVFAGHAQDWYSHSGLLFYSCRPNSNDWALFRVEGSDSLLLRTFPDAHHEGDIRMLGGLGNVLFFAAPGGRTNDVELWRTDGTPDGTRLVADLNTDLAQPTPIYGDAISNRAFYVLHNANTSPIPVRTGGRVGDSFSYSPATNATDMIRVGDKLFVVGVDPVLSFASNRLTVFPVSGGAPVSIPAGPGSSLTFADTRFLGAVNGRAIFSPYVSGVGYCVWSSDGTPSGTTQIWDLATGSGLEEPALYGYQVGGRLLFRGGDDSTNGYEVVATDGTAGGTYMVTNLNPGTSSGAPNLNDDRGGAVLGSFLYFRGNNGGGTGTELWRTDGTAGGTMLVSDIRPGASGSGPASFVTHGPHVYFTALTTNFGRELWRSDGTITELVRDIRPGTSSSLIELPASIGSRILFFATDSAEDVALWATDGTSNGTQRVRDIKPSPSFYIRPEGGWTAGGWYFFTCDDGVHGRELWASDGTSNNTFMIEDTSPGPLSTTISQAESAGNFLICQLARRSEGTLVREVRAIWPDTSSGTVTNPTVRIVSSVLTSSGSALVDPPYNAVSLAWTNTATNYVLEATEDVRQHDGWRAILTRPALSGGQIAATNFTPEPARAYRLRRY